MPEEYKIITDEILNNTVHGSVADFVGSVTYGVPGNGKAASATKTKVRTSDGGWIDKKHGLKGNAAALPCTSWRFEQRPMRGVADLFKLIDDAETASALDQTPGVLLRFALPVGVADAIGSRKTEDRLIDGLKVFNNLLPLDIDTGSFPDSWSDADRADLRKCADWLRSGLPAWLRGAGFVIQRTSSYGLKSGLRFRLYFLTSRPMQPVEIQAAFCSTTPALDGAALGLDHDPAFDASVFGFTAISYAAGPIFEDAHGNAVDDPITGPRSMLVHGPVAIVPDMADLEAAAAALGLSLIDGAFRSMIAPDGVEIDAAHVLQRGRDYLAATAHRPATVGVRIWLGNTANKLIDFGVDPATAIDMVIENAGDACAFPDDDREWALQWVGYRSRAIGCEYKDQSDRTADHFGAVADADDVGPARVATAKPAEPVFAFNFDVHARPGQGARYLLQDLLPHIPGETGSIVAASSSGKTTVACGMAAALATGSDYLGAKNRAGGPIGVLFVSGESFNDTSRSLSALQKRGALPLGSPVLHLAMPDPKHLQAMIDAADAMLFAETGVHLGVVFWDTLTRCFDYMFREKGQSSTEPNAELTRVLTELATSKGRAIAMWTLDHLGKDPTRGAIGSVAKDFNSAAILTLTKPRGQSVGSITVLKVKGSPDNLPSFGYQIEGEYLFDENLNPDPLGAPEIERITGAVARWVAATATTSIPALTPQRAKILGVLTAGKSMTVAEWLAGCLSASIPRATAQKAIPALVLGGFAIDRDGRCTVPASQPGRITAFDSGGYGSADTDEPSGD